MLRDGHLCLRRSTHSTRVVVEERRRLGDILAVIEREVIRTGHPAAVWCLVLIHQHEGTILVAAILQPAEHLIGDHIGHVAVLRYATLRGDELRIVVVALTGKDLPVIKSHRCGHQMPLPDDRRLVPGTLQQLWEGDLRRIEARSVVNETVQVTVFPRLDDGPARPADRVGNEGVVERHPLTREPIQVRRLVDLRTVRADRVRSVIVAEHEDDIGALASLLRRR